MKHFLRIAITIVVLVAVGFSSYFLFFKPDSDLTTFSKLSDTVDKRDSLGVDAKLNELYRFDGHGTKHIKYHKVKTVDANGDFSVGNKNYKIVDSNINYQSTEKTYFSFDNTNYPDIITYRQLLFKNGIPSENLSDAYKVNIDSLNVYSYVAIEKSLDSIFDYYFAYAQVMDGVKNSDQKVMNKTIKEYTSALTAFNAQLKSVQDYQKVYNLNTVDGKEKCYTIVESGSGATEIIVKEYSEYAENTNLSGKIELTSRYLELIKSYRNLLNKKCDLIEQLKNMVIKYVFGGEFIVEASTVKMDLTLMIIKSSFEREYDATETGALYNITHFVDIYMGVGSFKNGTSADAVLEKYNTIVTNAKGDLKTVLSLSNAQLNYLADNSTEVKTIMSTLNQKYISVIQDILKAYGFGVGV